jgi:hypothetical protein
MMIVIYKLASQPVQLINLIVTVFSVEKTQWVNWMEEEWWKFFFNGFVEANVFQK